jgi:predicted site-specific integrase-resolvase
MVVKATPTSTTPIGDGHEVPGCQFVGHYAASLKKVYLRVTGTMPIESSGQKKSISEIKDKKKMKGTAVLWVRVSSEGQAHGYSPDSQARLLEDAAKEYDVRETFSVTESAKVAENRKRFKEMVEYVKAGEIEHLFAWSHDRLARHYEDFATLQSLVDKHDVSIHLVESNKVISRESPIADRFMFQVLAALAESENRKRGAEIGRAHV